MKKIIYIFSIVAILFSSQVNAEESGAECVLDMGALSASLSAISIDDSINSYEHAAAFLRDFKITDSSLFLNAALLTVLPPHLRIGKDDLKAAQRSSGSSHLQALLRKSKQAIKHLKEVYVGISHKRDLVWEILEQELLVVKSREEQNLYRLEHLEYSSLAKVLQDMKQSALRPVYEEIVLKHIEKICLWLLAIHHKNNVEIYEAIDGRALLIHEHTWDIKDAKNDFARYSFDIPISMLRFREVDSDLGTLESVYLYKPGLLSQKGDEPIGFYEAAGLNFLKYKEYYWRYKELQENIIKMATKTKKLVPGNYIAGIRIAIREFKNNSADYASQMKVKIKFAQLMEFYKAAFNDRESEYDSETGMIKLNNQIAFVRESIKYVEAGLVEFSKFSGAQEGGGYRDQIALFEFNHVQGLYKKIKTDFLKLESEEKSFEALVHKLQNELDAMPSDGKPENWFAAVAKIEELLNQLEKVFLP